MRVAAASNLFRFGIAGDVDARAAEQFAAILPPTVARWLVSEGRQASHVIDLGLERASDRAIWERATPASRELRAHLAHLLPIILLTIASGESLVEID